MADWCLFGEAIDKDGELYPMAPDVVIVNVPDDIALNRKEVFRFLRKQAGEEDVELLSRTVVAPKYWGKKILCTGWGRLLVRLGFFHGSFSDRFTLIALTGEIPEDLRKGFMAFGEGFLTRFYDWAGSQCEAVMKQDFAVRHPDLMDCSGQEFADPSILQAAPLR